MTSKEQRKRVLKRFDSPGSVIRELGYEMPPAILEETQHFGANSAQDFASLHAQRRKKVLAKRGNIPFAPCAIGT
ncbi:unnamed protein product, partial [Bubo scandiacus]